MSKIITHIASKKDIPGLVELVYQNKITSSGNDLLTTTADKNIITSIITARITNKDLSTIVATINKAVVGFVTLNLTTTHMGVLHSVRKPRGVKQALITGVLNEAHKKGLDSVITQIHEVTPEIINLAYKNNFRPLGGEENPDSSLYLLCELRPQTEPTPNVNQPLIDIALTDTETVVLTTDGETNRLTVLQLS